jgi:hypothetical protein
LYFNVNFYPGGQLNKYTVLNNRLTPALTYEENISDYYNLLYDTTFSIQVKVDAGIDYNNDDIIENINYPTGYRAVYAYKYEMSEQQYADFLNTLTPAQISTIGIAGSSITLTNGQYFSANPNRACSNADGKKVLAYADWSGLRPMSFLEFNKIDNGPYQPALKNGSTQIANVGSLATSTTTKEQAGATYYGNLDFKGNVYEPVVSLSQSNFTIENGNGQLLANGNHDVLTWLASKILFLEYSSNQTFANKFGFRYIRSAE